MFIILYLTYAIVQTYIVVKYLMDFSHDTDEGLVFFVSIVALLVAPVVTFVVVVSGATRLIQWMVTGK